MYGTDLPALTFLIIVRRSVGSSTSPDSFTGIVVIVALAGGTFVSRLSSWLQSKHTQLFNTKFEVRNFPIKVNTHAVFILVGGDF